MKKKVTAPLSYDPGKGRPKEHLAYLNWQEMQQLRRLNGDNMERGPRGLPSFPPADAKGSSSKASSSSKPSGGGGRDSGSRDKGGAGTYKGVSGKGAGASTSRSSGPSVRGPVSRIPNSPSGVRSINVGPMQMPVSLDASRTPKTIKSPDNTDQIEKLGQKYNLPNFSPEKYNLAKKILSQPVPTDSLDPYSPSYRESISDYLNKSLYGDNLEGAQRVGKILGAVDTLAYAAPSIPLAKITEPVLKYVAKPVYNFVKGSSAGKAAKYGIDPRIQAELDAVYPAGKTEKPFMTEADVGKVLKKSDPTRSAAAKAEHHRATQPLPGERAWGTVEDYLDEATKALGLGTGDVARAKFAAGMGGAQEAAMYGVEKFSDYPSRNYENSEKGDYGGMRDGGVVGSKSKKQKITAPLSYDPGRGRPKEHLAYLNWQEMQELQRLNGGNMERGPRGLPSFPPADAIGSSSRVSSSRSYGGGGRDTGARGNVGMGRSSSYGRGVSDSRGGGPTARQGRSAPSMRGGPSGGGPVSRQGASSAVRPRVSKEEAARIVSRLDEMSRRLEREQREIFADKPDYLARGKIQDRVISAAAGQPYQMKTPTVYTGAPPKVSPAPKFSVNAMTTDLGRLQRGVRDRISQEAFIQAGYMPGFKSLGDIERDRKISAAVGQPYGMKTPISPAKGQPYGVKSPISPARGQPYGMNLPPSNVPSTEISAKTVPVKKDISDISKLTDEYSLASGMSFRGFPTIGAGQVEQRPTLAGIPSVIPRTPEDHMTSVLGTSYAQRWYPGEQMFRTPQEVSRDIAGYSPAGIEALRRSKTYSDRIPSDSSAPVSPSAQVPYTNVTVLQKAREPLRPFSAGASEGLPPGYSDRYLNKQADTSGETVLQVEDVPVESEFATKEEVKEAAKKAGFRPSVYESEDFLSDPNRLGMMAESPEDISPTDMAKLVSRAYGENYLTRSEKDRLAASNVIQRVMKLNPLSRLAIMGAEKIIKPEDVEKFLARPSYEQEELYRLGREMDERYGRRPMQEVAGQPQNPQVPGQGYDNRGQGGQGGGIGGLAGYGGAGGVSGGGMSGGGGSSVSQSGGRPYIYYQWDVGVNIPSPGDPDYTNYQEYLRQREEARAA